MSKRFFRGWGELNLTRILLSVMFHLKTSPTTNFKDLKPPKIVIFLYLLFLPSQAENKCHQIMFRTSLKLLHSWSCQWCIISFFTSNTLIVDGCSSMTNPVSLATFKLLASCELHLLLSSIFIFNINTLKIVLIGVKTFQGTFFHSWNCINKLVWKTISIVRRIGHLKVLRNLFSLTLFQFLGWKGGTPCRG